PGCRRLPAPPRPPTAATGPARGFGFLSRALSFAESCRRQRPADAKRKRALGQPHGIAMPADTLPPDHLHDDALDQAIASYVDAVDAGQTPDRADWLRRHPHVADGLAAFFADQDCLEPRVAPLRECLSSGCPLVAVADVFPPPGTRLGDYELLEEI